MDEPAVILNGNPSDGYTIVGPFPSWEEAANYDDRVLGGGNWVMNLKAPGEEKP